MLFLLGQVVVMFVDDDGLDYVWLWFDNIVILQLLFFEGFCLLVYVWLLGRVLQVIMVVKLLVCDCVGIVVLLLIFYGMMVVEVDVVICLFEGKSCFEISEECVVMGEMICGQIKMIYVKIGIVGEVVLMCLLVVIMV